MIRSRTFRFNGKLSLFSFFFLWVFLYLGNWQLDRSDEKSSMMALETAHRVQAPTSIGAVGISSSNSQGLPVEAQGSWAEGLTILLDNVVLNTKVGYEVLAVFEDETLDKAVLVNRGFIAAPARRDRAPLIPPFHSNRLQGHLHWPVKNTYVRDYGVTYVEELPLIQGIDIQLLEEALDLRLMPFVVRLRNDQPGALPRFWPVTNMLPEKHTGYAIQWFSMAAVVVLAWCWFSFPVRTGDGIEE